MNYYKYMSAKELGLCYSIIPFDQYNTICEPIPIRIASSYKLDKIDFRAHKENQRDFWKASNFPLGEYMTAPRFFFSFYYYKICSIAML